MALHLENARSGLIWNLVARNPNIQRALARLSTPVSLGLEAEAGTGDGSVMQRSAASNLQTVWLHAGMARRMSFQIPTAAPYRLSVRYSNDNYGPLETVTVSIDNQQVGQFQAQDTGDYGYGWNVFVTSGALGPVSVAGGCHEIAIMVQGRDGYGVEIDRVVLEVAP